ncbi:MAG: hypothetical protein KC431_02685, partial [Myxococcales bacterium]|nr:hypothetical protein [Myxococcales bacterium]
MSRFPTSRSTGDLEASFRVNVDKFVAALRKAGASVVISATKRPAERAYLMRQSWDISKGAVKPKDVPPRQGVAIEWDHGNDKASVDAAKAMLEGYGLAYRP